MTAPSMSRRRKLLLASALAATFLWVFRRDPGSGSRKNVAGVRPHSAAASPAGVGAPIAGYEVRREYPHDSQAFTQGLLFHDGALYEGTGINGSSSLRRVALETGEIQRIRTLPAQYFGEGIALIAGKLYQLTWRNHVCLVYDAASFEQVTSFEYPGEGWGLTTDGTELIMSDGTSVLRFIEPGTFRTIRTVTARESGRPVSFLNELEYVKGEIYANVWRSDRIVRIDPSDGTVSGWIDLTDLLPPSQRTGREDVLNGIAYDADADRLFVTGKYWPKLYEITLVGPAGSHQPRARAVSPAR